MSFYSIAPFIKEHYPQYYSIERYQADCCVTVCKVADKWGIFSNFAHTPILLDGIRFKTSEQLFQLMKFTEPEAIEAVYSANNPKMTAKHWEKKCRRTDWGCIIVDAMKFCLQQKYSQSKTFRQALAESKGKFIVENQTTFPKKSADTWGAKLKNDYFEGSNLLGRLLMELRDNNGLEYNLPPDALSFITVLKKNV